MCLLVFVYCHIFAILSAACQSEVSACIIQAGHNDKEPYIEHVKARALLFETNGQTSLHPFIINIQLPAIC